MYLLPKRYLIITFLGKLKKQKIYDHNNLLEAVSLSIENLNDHEKKLYKQLAVFLDDVGIPPKVSSQLIIQLGYKTHLYSKTLVFS